jgi:cellulose synthase/poly-beta-1,6-N-acetylglucosamine synthase-like glycosyltransferase
MILDEDELALEVVERAREGVATEPKGEDTRPAPELVSVIIPCFGQYEYTRLCVPSVLRHSRPPFILVFVDMGSLDGTAEYLAGLQAASPVRIEIARADEGAGLGAAFDQGLALARGRFVVLLSNDCIVTSGWLSQLTALADSDPRIVAVGPMSNYGTPPQLVKEAPYRLALRMGSPNIPEEALDRFSRDWHEQHRGQWFETDHLDTSCILFKREVLGAIGPLDRLPQADGAPLGARALDSKSLGLLIRRTGAKMACCQDLFIHHFGSRQSVLAAPTNPSSSRSMFP